MPEWFKIDINIPPNKESSQERLKCKNISKFRKKVRLESILKLGNNRDNPPNKCYIYGRATQLTRCDKVANRATHIAQFCLAGIHKLFRARY